MKRGQQGFTVVETLLVLILISIIGFTGYYVYHSRNNANSTYSNAADTAGSGQSVSKPTLDGAANRVRVVYSAWDNMITQGSKLEDQSQWANNPDNSSAAHDLQLINQHKSWFTYTFIAKANNYRSTNTTPPGFGLLGSQTGIAYYNNGSVKVIGNKLSGQMAGVTVTYTTGGSGTGGTTTHTIPVTLKDDNGVWAIDSIDLTSS